MFAVLAARKPLPPFQSWKGRDGLEYRWKHVAADDSPGVWVFQDGKVISRSSGVRGPLEKRPDGRPALFQEVCEFLAGTPGVEAITAIVFPVKPAASVAD